MASANVPQRPSLIVSGGQTGADQGGLLAAKKLGIPTGGYAPPGFLTEDGPATWLADFGLIEHPVGGYEARTWANVGMSDLTLIFGNINSRGSKLTGKACEWLDRPWVNIPGTWPVDSAVEMVISAHNMRRLWSQQFVLNIAGNRESVSPGIHEFVCAVLVEAIGNPTGARPDGR